MNAQERRTSSIERGHVATDVPCTCPGIDVDDLLAHHREGAPKPDPGYADDCPIHRLTDQPDGGRDE